MTEDKKTDKETKKKEKLAKKAAKKEGKKLSPTHEAERSAPGRCASKASSDSKKQKIRGGLLILIGTATLIFVGYFLFAKLFSPQDLAELLPAEKTVAVLEVNIDGNDGQPQQFFELLDKYPVYNKDGIIALINTVLPVNYQNELEPWLGRKIGLAILQTKPSSQTGTSAKTGSPSQPESTSEPLDPEVPNSQANFSTIFFIESKDQELALKFMESRTIDGANEKIISSDYNGLTTYEFAISQKINFTFINSYMVVTDSKQALTAFLDDYLSFQQGSQQTGQPVERLYVNEDYRKVANNLPQGGLIFAYINLNKMVNTLEQDPLFVAQKGQDLLALRPFINVFKAEGLTIFAENDRFIAQTFVSIDTEALDGENYITFNEKYQGELLSLANENPIFIAGGHDLTKELNRIEDIFKSGTKTPALVFEGMVEAQKHKYFGKDVSLQGDIYPLFTGEYLMTIENSFEKPVVSMLLELQDNSSSVAKFDKIVNEFIKVSGVFSPRIQEVELPDGTIGKEIVASPEKIERSTGKHQGASITSLKLGETGIAIHYAMLGNIVAMSTNEETLKTMIDRYEGNIDTSLTTTKYYTDTLQRVMRSADQMLHIKVGALTETLGLNKNEMLVPYITPFNDLTITKNFFKDGISTTYLIDIL